MDNSATNATKNCESKFFGLFFEGGDLFSKLSVYKAAVVNGNKRRTYRLKKYCIFEGFITYSLNK